MTQPNDPCNIEFDVKNVTSVSVLELSNKFPCMAKEAYISLARN